MIGLFIGARKPGSPTRILWVCRIVGAGIVSAPTVGLPVVGMPTVGAGHARESISVATHDLQPDIALRRRLSIAPQTGFALTASPFWQTPQKEPKGLCPCIRVSLRSTPLTPSLLRGHAAKGHPWPIAALAASMPLNPLHNDSTRPSDGAFGVACEIGAQETLRSQSIAATRLCSGSAFFF